MPPIRKDGADSPAWAAGGAESSGGGGVIGATTPPRLFSQYAGTLTASRPMTPHRHVMQGKRCSYCERTFTTSRELKQHVLYSCLFAD